MKFSFAAAAAAVALAPVFAFAIAFAAPPALAAPFTPTADSQVLATVPARATDPRSREIAALRRAWQAAPQDEAAALALARRCFDEAGATGDPRYAGCAEAALKPWWALPAPPPEVRVMRAVLAQYEHRFDDALADLDGALQAEPGNTAGWAWRTAILLVRARYAEARPACERLAALASALVGAACRAQIDGLTGSAAAAAASLRAALAPGPGTAIDPAERLWALTRLAEIEERRGQVAAAEAAFEEALALGLPDIYLRAAHADFLLDQKRPAEVVQRLQDSRAADVLLLRLAIAAKATAHAQAATWRDELGARFAAAAQRGDNTHRKEESRFVLALQGDAARALALAQQNWAEQREAADARLLLEAALAARTPAAAQPVLDWMAASKIESGVLSDLAVRLKAAR